MRSVLIALCTLPPAVAVAQTSPYTIHIVVDPPVIEPGQEATIELRAGFDGARDWAIALLDADVLCSAGGSAFEDLMLFGPLTVVAGATPGVQTGLGVEGIACGQYQWHDEIADPTNPMPFWRAEYAAAPDADIGAVELTTQARRYDVYPSFIGASGESRLDEYVDGTATLTIVACRADFDGDGAADLFDFLAFQTAFDAGDPLADFDFDGALTVFDFLAFQDRFDQGCP